MARQFIATDSTKRALRSSNMDANGVWLIFAMIWFHVCLLLFTDKINWECVVRCFCITQNFSYSHKIVSPTQSRSWVLNDTTVSWKPFFVQWVSVCPFVTEFTHFHVFYSSLRVYWLDILQDHFLLPFHWAFISVWHNYTVFHSLSAVI